MSSQITGEVKMGLLESFPEGLARFFNFQHLLGENSLAADLYEAGRSENVIEDIISQELATKLWKAGCSSRIVEDIISQENPGRDYRIFTARDFNYRTNYSECDDAWNSEFRSANEENIPSEVAGKIGDVFDVFYRFKNCSSISKLESVLSSDARIADLAQGTMETPVELPARLARICHDYLYEAADFALREKAKKLQEDYNKAIGKNTDGEFVVLTYNAKPHTVSGVNKDYNYRIGENFKLHVIGTDKNSKEMVHKAVTAEPDFLNLILCEDKDDPEQYFSAETFNQRTNILPMPENLKPELENYIRNLKFDGRIIRGYDAVKLPNGDRIIPVLDDSENAYHIRPVFNGNRNYYVTSKHAKKDFAPKRLSETKASFGAIYLDWQKDADKLIEYITIDGNEHVYSILPVFDRNRNCYVTSKHARKGFALRKMNPDGASTSTIKTPSGVIYLDWYAGADNLVRAIVDKYWENTHYFH